MYRAGGHVRDMYEFAVQVVVVVVVLLLLLLLLLQ
jgi:hypothetical protein